MDLHEKIAKEQGPRGVVPPHSIQHSKLTVCCVCREPIQRREQAEGYWENGMIFYYHLRCVEGRDGT